MAIDWNRIYRQKLTESQKSYDRENARLNSELERETQALEQNFSAAGQELKNSREAAQNEAYLNMNKNRLQLPEQLRRAGLSGGVSETAIASLLRDYQNARNSADTSYTRAQAELAGSHNTDINDLKGRYAKLFADLSQKQKDETAATIQAAYNAAADAEKAAEDKRRWQAEIAAQKERYAQKLKDEQLKREEDKRRWEAENALKVKELEAKLTAQAAAAAASAAAAQKTAAASSAKPKTTEKTAAAKKQTAGTASTSKLSASDKYFANGGTMEQALQNLSAMISKQNQNDYDMRAGYVANIASQIPMDEKRDSGGNLLGYKVIAPYTGDGTPIWRPGTFKSGNGREK